MRLPFPFPGQQRIPPGYRSGNRGMFGREQPQQGGMSSAVKARILIALAIVAFAVISYYVKPLDENEVTGEKQRVALTEEADEVQLGLQAAPEMVSQHGGPSRNARDQQAVQAIGARLIVALVTSDLFTSFNPQPKAQAPVGAKG